ncbi:MAG: dihydrofolate reductase [Acinetobacter sp.]
MYKDKKVIHIVARGYNGEIGANNKLLWDIPEDMKHFRESTIGHVVLTGRKTFEGLTKPLKNRIVLPVSSQAGELEDFLLEAIEFSLLTDSDFIFIAGGGKLYKSTFDIVDELWVTQVEKSYPNADTFYHIPDNFELADEVYGDGCKDVGYSFQKWVRN